MVEITDAMVEAAMRSWWESVMYAMDEEKLPLKNQHKPGTI